MDIIKEKLNGKVCLITGASRTLGAVIARRLALCGAQIVINYRHDEAAAVSLCRELSDFGIRAVPIQADVSRQDDVTRLVSETAEHFEMIDILVNNVGPYVETPFLELLVADFDRILNGNLRATFLMSQAIGKGMKKRGSGHIINITATDSYHRSHSVYGLAKSGVIFLTEAMALELAPEVRINAIAPDLIAENEDMPSEAFVQQAVAGTPMGRLVTRSEIAEMVCLLNTPAFDSVTGRTIVMDGGRSIPRIATG